MMENGTLIKDNYFGLNVKDQRRVYDAITSNLDNVLYSDWLKEDFEGVFSDHLLRKESLYQFNYYASILNKKHISKFFAYTEREFLDYIIFDEYKGYAGFSRDKFNNLYAREFPVDDDYHVFFKFNKVNTENVDLFIESFKNSSDREKIEFLEDFMNTYVILEDIDYDIPEEKLIEHDFDDAVKRVFGLPAFLWYQNLTPSQKLHFIEKFGYALKRYYEDKVNIKKDNDNQEGIKQDESSKTNTHKLHYVNKNKRVRR